MESEAVLRDRVGQLRRRVRLLVTGRWIFAALVVASLLCSVLVILDRLEWISAPPEYLAGVLAFGALVGAGVGLTRREAAQTASGLTMRQLRMLELARALASQPRLLLLDEILAGLGHAELEDVISAVQRIAREGTTVLIVEHTMHAMVRLADRFSVLDHGALIADGPPAEVTRNAAVIEAYLGRKWVQRVADRVA